MFAKDYNLCEEKNYVTQCKKGDESQPVKNGTENEYFCNPLCPIHGEHEYYTADFTDMMQSHAFLKHGHYTNQTDPQGCSPLEMTLLGNLTLVTTVFPCWPYSF